MASPIIIFQTVGSNAPSTPFLGDIKDKTGVLRIFFGQKIEDPTSGVLVTEWSSQSGARAYISSELARNLQAKETLAYVLNAADIFTAAPCTEVFTAFGAEEGFGSADGNVGRFVSGLEETGKPEGYFGAAFGEEVALVGGGGETGGEENTGRRSVRLVIGWESKDAHVKAKEQEEGAIQRYIHELRSGREAVELYHVALTQL
ncbi:hypothetical protein QBC35DRAFT_71309 [Podospora australis]|uniref:ABM domain-containing protein n=1 Tax=Podospora australis TaxID=1536484 RepID=A0AAN6X1T6_9PEZI|nr:hypothetical protein QBC35DRAFT_71309 [Podospora australis]